MTEKGMGIVIHLMDLLVLLRKHQIFDSNYTVQYTLLFYIIVVFFVLQTTLLNDNLSECQLLIQ